MGRAIARVLGALAGAALVISSSLPAHAAAGDTGGEHEAALAFWTTARVAHAVPRDVVRDPVTGAFRITHGHRAARPVLGASWTRGGEVAGTTGKVVFALGAEYYVCSASVVHALGEDDDGLSDRSLVLTAAHCAFDEATGQFATNWVFVPDYDSKPARLTTDGSFCAETLHGCWAAEGLLVDSVFAGESGFTLLAAQHDVAVAVLGPGGHSGTAQLDDVVDSQPVRFRPAREGERTFVFGYPAVEPYTGDDLVFSRGALGRDPEAGDVTYRVGSTMTGGSSGGPWFARFVPGGGRGVQISVSSYGYVGVDAMHGPVLGADAAAVYAAATDLDLTDDVPDDVVVPAGS
jgi:hypothetical protein